MSETILMHVRELLQKRVAAGWVEGAEERPVCVLWPDEARQFEPAVARMREVMPELLVLGEYDPAKRTGPAVWVRCVLDGTIEVAGLPEDMTPVVYLPGVSREMIRRVKEMPGPIQPLAILQYEGVLWNQAGNRDWSLMSVLGGDRKYGGLGLDVAKDAATQEAMRRAVLPLMDVTIEKLRKGRLEASDFDRLLVGDVNRQVLEWMADPKGMRAGMSREGGAAWGAFASAVRSELSLDPSKATALDAAEKLGSGGGGWDDVWERFAQSPGQFPHVKDLLTQAKPGGAEGLFAGSGARWPSVNAEAEAKLRKELLALAEKRVEEVRERLPKLAAEHRVRRTWVWAKLGEARLAEAVEKLEAVRAVTEDPLCGPDPASIAARYVADGWRTDWAVLEALDTVRGDADFGCVGKVVAALYRPWLDAGARSLQDAVKDGSLPTPDQQADYVSDLPEGTCLLFVDGLRLDLARALEDKLAGVSLAVESAWRWSTVPTVTASAKPAVSPVLGEVGAKPGVAVAKEFAVWLKQSGDVLNTERFARLLKDHGVQKLANAESGSPEGRGWTEIGDVDSRGHKEGAKLAWRVGEELDRVVERVRALLDAGWQEVRVVTDHGWLLCPGGLAKMEVGSFVAETKWGRCLAIGESNKAHGLALPWSWESGVQIDLAVGAGAFYKGKEYAHGGVSPQESVIATLTVRAKAAPRRATINDVKWAGLRCVVTVENAEAGMVVDLRAATGESVLEGDDGPVAIHGGQARLFASDEVSEAEVVVLDTEGTVVAKKKVDVPV